VKILLLNDNPVVNKLVTLSAQKTSDEVEIISNIEDIQDGEYDLVIVDDSIYNDDLLETLNQKVKFKRSLFIGAKDVEVPAFFSSVLNKPFLPTDLVELFAMVEKELTKEDIPIDEPISGVELENIESLDDFENVDDLDLESELGLDEEVGLEEELNQSILDENEAQKVKELLDENEEEISFDEQVENDLESLELDELAMDEIQESEFENESSGIPEEIEPEESQEEDLLADYNMALDLEDEADADISEDSIDDLLNDVEELEGLETLEEMDVSEEETKDIEEDVTEEPKEELIEELAEPEEDVIKTEVEMVEEELPEESEEEIVEEVAEPEEELPETDIEDEIQNAVDNLTQEDLESELDEETLLQIATNEIDPLAGLSSKDLKAALGEEVEEEPESIEAEDIDEVQESDETQEIETSDEDENSGVDALKKLLEALNDKDVAAKMKGMKISINITLGEN